jgi:hypothetical protein
MRPLDMPRMDPEAVLRITTSRIANAELRARFDDSVPVLLNDGDAFVDAGQRGQLSSLDAADFPLGTLSEGDLRHHYDRRFARRGSPGRDYYDELLLSPTFGRCPYCGVGVVATLDHYLPKDDFPAISVLPANLVPSCRDCNHEKLRYKPSPTSAALLHPYFDDVDSAVWLVAQVIEGEPPGVIFDVEREIAAPLRARLIKHLEQFGLHSRYASYAGELIAQLELDLSQLFRAAGAEAVASHLMDLATVRSTYTNNGWDLAVIRALAANDWYCLHHFADLS